MEDYLLEGLDMKTFNSDHFTSRSLLSTVKIITNYSLLGILVIGLILISYLIYRKHKGEKGLWKKILKRDLIFFFIIVVVWFIISFALWYFPSRPIQPGSFN